MRHTVGAWWARGCWPRQGVVWKCNWPDWCFNQLRSWPCPVDDCEVGVAELSVEGPSLAQIDLRGEMWSKFRVKRQLWSRRRPAWVKQVRRWEKSLLFSLLCPALKFAVGLGSVSSFWTKFILCLIIKYIMKDFFCLSPNQKLNASSIPSNAQQLISLKLRFRPRQDQFRIAQLCNFRFFSRNRTCS